MKEQKVIETDDSFYGETLWRLAQCICRGSKNYKEAKELVRQSMNVLGSNHPEFFRCREVQAEIFEGDGNKYASHEMKGELYEGIQKREGMQSKKEWNTRIQVSKVEIKEKSLLKTVKTERELLEKTCNEPETFVNILLETAETFI